MRDATGVAVQKWIIKNAFVTAADFGQLDYGQDALATIQITLRMDYCILAF